jgi:cell division septation protein DedD
MEDFAPKEQKGIKEKNLYILHLDTPRIIIISSVIAGLIIIAALIGMNINRFDPADTDNLSGDSQALENLGNNSKTNPLENNHTEPGLSSENLFKNQENPNPAVTADNSIKDNSLKSEDIIGSKENIPSSNMKDSKELAGNNTADILTHENIESIIPPVKPVKKQEVKKTARKSREKRIEKRKGIIEVSESSPADKSYKSSSSGNRGYFAVQVASFDRKSKAVAEMNILEKKKYNAYLDSAKVNDKTFYRVMVGPIDSKKKACELMDELSADSRYEESYIIKK